MAGKNRIYDNALETIGSTPLVRINSITKAEGIECEILAKWEGRNPGGSVKDRPVYRMILEAEKDGVLKPGMTIVEPTSGNTGIAVAMVSAVLGYKCVLIITDKFSKEKVDIMSALGATSIRATKLANEDSPDSHIGVAKQLLDIIPNSFMPQQYHNPNNPLSHYDTTADEIYEACEGKLDYLVAGVGTCGTICGISKKLKQKLPNLKVVAADPVNSILTPGSDQNPKKPFFVEGIGLRFYPKNLNYDYIDEWINITDTETFNMARRVIREEGMLIGGSAGAAMAAAVKLGKRLTKGERIVVIQPDSVRNYMTTFINDDWMIEKQLPIEHPKDARNDITIKNAKLNEPLVGIEVDISAEHAVKSLRESSLSFMAVQNELGLCTGLASLGNLEFVIKTGKIKPSQSVTDCMYPTFAIVDRSATYGDIFETFKDYPFIVVSKGSLDRNHLPVADIEGILDPLVFYESLNNL